MRGTVRIEKIAGDVELTHDTIDLRATDLPGDLIISTLGEGMARLSSLDFQMVGNALFSVEKGWAAASITNALQNFDTSHSEGDGSWELPYLTTQTKLRVPAEQQIKYAYLAGALNDYLGGHCYRVADLDGQAGQGGVLTPVFREPPGGTLLLVR